MDNKKINKVILFFVSSFFYFLVLFFGLQLMLKSKGNDLPDTLVMMSLYFTLGATLLFFLQFDNLLNLFQKKAVKIVLIIFPIFIVVIGYVFTLSKDLNDNIEKPNYEEQKKNQEIFNNSEIELDLSSINKNLVYKEYEDKLLSEGKDGTIRQFKEVSEDRLLDCTFELFLINDKKIIACDYNNSLNYYIKEMDSIRLSIWDTCGEEIYNNNDFVPNHLYKSAVCYIIVISYHSKESLDDSLLYIDYIKQHVNRQNIQQNPYLIALINKKDLKDKKYNLNTAVKSLKEHSPNLLRVPV